MKIDRTTVFVLLLAFGIGYVLSSNPIPQPRPDRPVARWFARAARTALFWMAFAEQAPQQAESQQLVHARVGADGQPLLDHGSGW